MAITRQHSIEIASAAGTAINGTNSAISGQNTFTQVGGTISLSATAAHGTRGAVTAATAVVSYLGWTVPATLTFAYRYYFNITTAPSATTQVAWVSADGTNPIHTTNLRNDRKLTVTTSTAGTSFYTSTTTPALNTWYRVECEITVATATTGVIAWRLYLGDSTTPLETATAKTDANFGTDGITVARFGKAQAPNTMVLVIDDLATSNDTAPIGPVVAAAGTVFPASILSNPGGWTEFGGAGSIVAALGDSSDSSGVRSVDDPASATFTAVFPPLTPGTPVKVTVRHDSPAGDGNINMVYDLMDGTTVVATRTATALPTTTTEFTFTTTSTETAAITSWSALRLRASATKVA